MKKLVSILLVALMLTSVSIALAEQQLWLGDIGGKFQEQIGKAIGPGGEPTGEPLPDLPWQYPPNTSKAVAFDFDFEAAILEALDVLFAAIKEANPSASDAEIEAEIDTILSEGSDLSLQELYAALLVAILTPPIIASP